MTRPALILRTDPYKVDLPVIRKAAGVIRSGGLVAFPTETVYGLGANALDGEAVSRLFEVKMRALDDPVIIHISDITGLKALVREVPPLARRLAERFWPGPLTMVLARSEIVPDIVTAGLDTVAVRMPSSEVARAVITEAALPVAAPSANMFGRVSPTSAGDVLEELDGRIDMIIDAGRTEIGIESTVVDVTSAVPKVLRPGGVGIEELSEALGAEVALEKDTNILRRSPGAGSRHYSPSCGLIVVEEGPEQVSKVLEAFKDYSADGLSVGILSTEEHAYLFPEKAVCVLGPAGEGGLCARRLYSALRELDRDGHDIIIAEAVSSEGLGLAVMNRLYKAAGLSS